MKIQHRADSKEAQKAKFSKSDRPPQKNIFRRKGGRLELKEINQDSITKATVRRDGLGADEQRGKGLKEFSPRTTSEPRIVEISQITFPRLSAAFPLENNRQP
jgi:hypothetical protein